MKKLFKKILGVFTLAALNAAAGQLPMQHAILVQNSGWMEPFFEDTNSKFKPLVAAVTSAVVARDEQVHLIAFSQATPENKSPDLLVSSRGPSDISPMLAGLKVAQKGPGKALADTDFREAVTGTIKGPFESRPGILWIFTNNKNSPNNDAQTAQRNQDFYKLLHLEPSITRTLAFALRMPVKGKLYEARGLMVYALAYGDSAAVALDRIVAESNLSKVLVRPSARLKPLDQDPVSISPEGVVKATGMTISLASDKRTLILDAASQDLMPRLELEAKLHNIFYPYEIKGATLTASLDSGGGAIPVLVSPADLNSLVPGIPQKVLVNLEMPTARVPSTWSLQALMAMGKQVMFPMTLEIRLNNQELILSQAFKQELRDLFPGDPISDVFTPPKDVQTSIARIPMLLRMQYPLTPVLIMMMLLLLSVGGLLGSAVMFGRTKRHEFNVNGVKRMVALKGFGRQTLRDPQGQIIGEVGALWGQPKVVEVAEGNTISIKKN